MNAKKIKVSMFVEYETWEINIQRLNKMPEIRRDELLDSWLGSIIGELEKQPINTLSQEPYWLFVNDHIPLDKKKVNVSFNKETIARLDKVLKEKKVPRGLFLSVFVHSIGRSIDNLQNHISNPFEEDEGEDKPLYRELFPSPSQAKQVEQKYNELIDSLRNLPDDF